MCGRIHASLLNQNCRNHESIRWPNWKWIVSGSCQSRRRRIHRRGLGMISWLIVKMNRPVVFDNSLPTAVDLNDSKSNGAGSDADATGCAVSALSSQYRRSTLNPWPRHNTREVGRKKRLTNSVARESQCTDWISRAREWRNARSGFQNPFHIRRSSGNNKRLQCGPKTMRGSDQAKLSRLELIIQEDKSVWFATGKSVAVCFPSNLTWRRLRRSVCRAERRDWVLRKSCWWRTVRWCRGPTSQDRPRRCRMMVVSGDQD